MLRRQPRSTRTEHTLSLHDALPIYCHLAGTSPEFLRSSQRSLVRRLVCFRGPGHPHPKPRTLEKNHLHPHRSEEHTSELQSLMRISYAVFCLKNKTTQDTQQTNNIN